jgi:hypothetical protein
MKAGPERCGAGAPLILSRGSRGVKRRAQSVHRGGERPLIATLARQEEADAGQTRRTGRPDGRRRLY